MGPTIRMIACLLALVVLLPAPATSGASTPARARASAHSLVQSRQLWATIDMCNPSDQPRYVGVRGSMPGDGRAADSMYMRFRLQYVNATTGQWTDFARGPTPAFVAVGSARIARQLGRSFQVRPQQALTLRGVVSFQWRQGSRVLASVSRVTTAGRESLKGSDPAGFSAATCRIA
jgi:hypothetical protein